MRIRTSAAAAGLILLAACGAKNDKAGSGNAAAAAGSGTAAPAASAAAVHIEPGEWEMTFETTRIGGGALPPAAAAAMAGRKVTSRHCITPEEASQESAKLLSGREDGHCDRSNFAMADGRIHGTITCQGAGQNAGTSKVVMTMDGQYSPQAYDYTMSMTNSGQGMAMNMESHTSGHRIGACTGKD